MINIVEVTLTSGMKTDRICGRVTLVLFVKILVFSFYRRIVFYIFEFATSIAAAAFFPISRDSHRSIRIEGQEI